MSFVFGFGGCFCASLVFWWFGFLFSICSIVFFWLVCLLWKSEHHKILGFSASQLFLSREISSSKIGVSMILIVGGWLPGSIYLEVGEWWETFWMMIHITMKDGETGEPPTYKKCWVACGVSGLRTLVMSSMVWLKHQSPPVCTPCMEYVL